MEKQEDALGRAAARWEPTSNAGTTDDGLAPHVLESPGQEGATLHFSRGEQIYISRASTLNLYSSPSSPEWHLVFRSAGGGFALCPSCGVHGVSDWEEWQGQTSFRRLGRKCQWCGWKEERE